MRSRRLNNPSSLSRSAWKRHLASYSVPVSGLEKVYVKYLTLVNITFPPFTFAELVRRWSILLDQRRVRTLTPGRGDFSLITFAPT